MKHDHPNSFKAKDCQLCKIEAAAPDLLEALKDMTTIAGDMNQRYLMGLRTDGEYAKKIKLRFDKARAAIAKAEEVQP